MTFPVALKDPTAVVASNPTTGVAGSGFSPMTEPINVDVDFIMRSRVRVTVPTTVPVPAVATDTVTAAATDTVTAAATDTAAATATAAESTAQNTASTSSPIAFRIDLSRHIPVMALNDDLIPIVFAVVV